MQRLLVETALSAPPAPARGRLSTIVKVVIGIVVVRLAWVGILVAAQSGVFDGLLPGDARSTAAAPETTAAAGTVTTLPMPSFASTALIGPGTGRQVHLTADNSAGSFDVFIDTADAWFHVIYLDGPAGLQGAQFVVDPAQVFAMDPTTLGWTHYGAPLPDLWRAVGPARVQSWGQVVTPAALPFLELRSTEANAQVANRTGYHLRLDVETWRRVDPTGFEAWRDATDVFGSASLMSPTSLSLAPVYDLMLDVDEAGSIWGWRLTGGGTTCTMEVQDIVPSTTVEPIPATYTET